MRLRRTGQRIGVYVEFKDDPERDLNIDQPARLFAGQVFPHRSPLLAARRDDPGHQALDIGFQTVALCRAPFGQFRYRAVSDRLATPLDSAYFNAEATGGKALLLQVRDCVKEIGGATTTFRVGWQKVRLGELIVRRAFFRMIASIAMAALVFGGVPTATLVLTADAAHAKDKGKDHARDRRDDRAERGKKSEKRSRDKKRDHKKDGRKAKNDRKGVKGGKSYGKPSKYAKHKSGKAKKYDSRPSKHAKHKGHKDGRYITRPSEYARHHYRWDEHYSGKSLKYAAKIDAEKRAYDSRHAGYASHTGGRYEEYQGARLKFSGHRNERDKHRGELRTGGRGDRFAESGQRETWRDRGDGSDHRTRQVRHGSLDQRRDIRRGPRDDGTLAGITREIQRDIDRVKRDGRAGFERDGDRRRADARQQRTPDVGQRTPPRYAGESVRRPDVRTERKRRDPLVASVTDRDGSDKLRNLSAARASSKAFENASSRSNVGKIAAYQTSAEAYYGSRDALKMSVRDLRDLEAGYDGRSNKEILSDIAALDPSSPTFDDDFDALGDELRASKAYEIERRSLIKDITVLKHEVPRAAAEAEDDFLAASKGRMVSPQVLREFHQILGLPVPVAKPRPEPRASAEAETRYLAQSN